MTEKFMEFGPGPTSERDYMVFVSEQGEFF